jgi:hypothetical protein
MSEVFRKLNLKEQTELLILNAPASFEPEMAALEGRTLRREADDVDGIDFLLAFVTRQAEVDALAALVGAKARCDAVVWFAYPKGTSRRYRCEFNRDTGWAELGKLGFEGVRQVAIDEDWSALRFRRAAFIKSMTRAQERALSDEGQARVTKGT